MKNFKAVLLFLAIASITAIQAQEATYEKECEKIDGFVYSGDFDGGIKYLKKVISQYDTPGLLPDSICSFFMQELAKMYYYAEDYKLAEKEMLKSLALDKKLKGEKSNDYLTGLSSMVELYRLMGLYEKSISLCSSITALYDQIEVTDSIGYAFYLNNCGTAYYSIGNLTQAEFFLDHAKIVNDNLFGKGHPDKAPLLNNLAGLNKSTGNYGIAEKMYLEVLAIDKTYYGENHTIVAIDLNNLADLYIIMGDFDRAEKLLIKAKNIYELNNKKRMGYVYVLSNLAEIYLIRGDFDKAESFCKMGLSITDTLVGNSHQINTSLFRRLAKTYFAKKEFEQAIATISRAIIDLNAINPDHIDLVSQLYFAGRTYSAMSKYDSAEIKFRESLRIAEVYYEKSHMNYVKSLNALAEVLYRTHRTEESEALFVESMDLFIQNIYQNFDFLSADEKRKYLSVLNDNLHRFNSFAAASYTEDQNIACEMFDYNLLMKSLILTSSKRVKSYGLNDTSNIEFRKTYDKWIRTKEYLAKVYSLTKSEIELREINIDSIQNIANTLEKQLTMESAVFSKQHPGKRHSWRDIKQRLDRDEAFVQIVRFPQSGSIIYAALIVSANDAEYPQLIILNDDGVEMENEQYESYLTNLTNGYFSNAKYNDTGAYYNYWEKIEKLVSNKKTVFLMPDGVYNKINVAALMMENEKFVYEKHRLVLLTTINDFVDPANTLLAKSNTAVLIGAPDFSMGCQSESMIAEELVNVPDDNQKLRSQILTPIPMSGTEVRYIDSLLNEFSWKTLLFINQNATEEMVKMLGSPEILHISTHGFFNTLNRNSENQETVQFPETDFTASINPLFCSGLYLAGAQNSLNGNYLPDEYSEDGILTAYEVANLNLDSTRLVVLSACETGLGEILSGEGVFGLQRAFSVAGAEHIIMSLWKVDDRATQLFMKKFYTFWLSGDTKSKAFDKAINFLRFDTQDYTHPVYWGGFVLLGNEQEQTTKTSAVLIFISLIAMVLLIFVALKGKLNRIGMFTF